MIIVLFKNCFMFSSTSKSKEKKEEQL